MKILDRGCIVTHSGIVFNLLNPDIWKINIEDIAHGLSNTCRWNGHTHRFLSVAQHCCLMHDEAEKAKKAACLMHDAEEAYWGDIVNPIKNLYPDLKERTDSLRKMIFKRFKIVYNEQDWEELDQTHLEREYENAILKHHEWFLSWTPVKAKKEFLSRFEMLNRPEEG